MRADMIAVLSRVGFVLALAWACEFAGAQVVINEFMASNSSTLADQDGDYSDLIELSNSGECVR